MGELNGQTYLVTGASKGIGRSISLELAVPRCSRDPSVEGTVRNSTKRPPTSSHRSLLCRTRATSARLPPSMRAVSHHSRRARSELHGLVHNAGDIHPIKPLFGADTADWARSMMVNLVGVQHLTQALARRSRANTVLVSPPFQAALRFARWRLGRRTARPRQALTCGRGVWPRKVHNTTSRRSRSHPASSIRECKPPFARLHLKIFPLLDNFVGYHVNGDLSDADTVAKALYGLITAHTEGQSGQRFDVRDL